MIPENTIENKAAFMALYWGQDVVKSGNPADQRTYNVEGANIEDENYYNRKLVIEDSYLELKALSQISDEDTTETVYLHWPDKREQIVDVNWAKLIVDTIVIHRDVTDFLRSRGYALPWHGLSVDELIQRGWVKLKEEVEK